LNSPDRETAVSDKRRELARDALSAILERNLALTTALGDRPLG
jgi:hypothetical protein